MVVVEPVWLCRHRGDCREGRASGGRARDVDAPVPQIQEQTVELVKEIPQEIDVEKLMDEDVDATILQPDDVGNGMVVQPEDVSTVTVEAEQPKIKTVVKCIEDGDFYSQEKLVCVPEA